MSMDRKRIFGVTAVSIGGPFAIAIARVEHKPAQIAIAAAYALIILGMAAWSLQRPAQP